MSAEELKALLSTPAALFALMLLASLGSAWKQMLVARRSGTGASVQSYFLDNWPETMAMIGHNVIAFVMLIFTDTLNPAAAIGLGYIANDAADAYTKLGRSFSIGPNDEPSASNKQKGLAQPLMLAILLVIAVPTMAMLHGCASLGVPTPQTFSERLASGYVSATSIRTSATTLLNGAVITSEDAENLQKQADVAREGLDVARTLPSLQAEDKLQTTLLILQAAQTYLCGKNPNDPNCAR